MRIELIDPFGTVIAQVEIEFLPETLTVGALTQGRPGGTIFLKARKMTAEERGELTEQIAGRGGEFIQRRPVNAQMPYQIKVS